MKAAGYGIYGDPNRELAERLANDDTVHVGYSHAIAYHCGWWHDPVTGELKERNVPEMLMLIVSEVAEAMEAFRKDKNDDHLPHRKGLEVELADAAIRIYDLAYAAGLDLEGAIREKLRYNVKRPDHKAENRVLEGGKKF